MLKGELITSIKEFVQTKNVGSLRQLTEQNRWVFTYYVIQYDGTNECKQDISRFIGGFPYGDLTLVNTALITQYLLDKQNPAIGPFRNLEECIEVIREGDWVVLSCGKFFVVLWEEIPECMSVWGLEEIPFDLNRFKTYYGNESHHVGMDLYGKSYRKKASFV